MKPSAGSSRQGNDVIRVCSRALVLVAGVFFWGEHEDQQKLGDAMVVPGKQMMRTSKYILVSGTKT